MHLMDLSTWMDGCRPTPSRQMSGSNRNPHWAPSLYSAAIVVLNLWLMRPKLCWRLTWMPAANGYHPCLFWETTTRP
ncbi:hypothetical protein C8035_v007286 [Colletotrichum spinosum]|uniref:Uncharacterized protein n=1 Tax=Colletotrichum spinosum TaxID=1347390 RepID=A0A4V3HT51_9PEZI|nr:hypothetical protein C8035_v007286 [Colletotrichum spinosum]